LHERGKSLNQILQYVILIGMSGIVFSVVFAHFSESLQLESISQQDRNEIEKKHTAEYLKTIEIMENPLRIDLINLGSDDIVIKKLFVGGVIDSNYLIDGDYSNYIIINKIVTITPSLTGESISLISENYKNFKLR